MAETSSIEWTDATWNPVTGCSVISPGCAKCYAMKLAGGRLQHHPSRAGLTQPSNAGPVWNGQVRFNAEWLDQPLRWARPRMIFVCAHGDLFHEGVADAVIDQVFAVMGLAHWHTFQVLTKRPDRMKTYLTADGLEDRVIGRMPKLIDQLPRFAGFGALAALSRAPFLPLTNLWLGVSAEDQVRADERIPALLATPAAVRFLSAEPLLGPMNLRYRTSEDRMRCWDYLSGQTGVMQQDGPDFDDGPGLDWVIAGGESGPGARPMHPDWARQIRDDCATARVAFFFKQWGEWLPCVEDFEDTGRAICFADDGTDVDRFEDFPRRPIRRFTKPEHSPQTMWRVGKKAAGRMLDGVTHDALPAVRP